MTEKALYVLMGLFVIILSLLLLSYNEGVSDKESFKPIREAPLVDSDGCVISTGYVWSESKGYCVSPEDLEKEPDKCAGEYRPVCGIDSVTYDSPCHAGDVKIVKFGSC